MVELNFLSICRCFSLTCNVRVTRCDMVIWYISVLWRMAMIFSCSDLVLKGIKLFTLQLHITLTFTSGVYVEIVLIIFKRKALLTGPGLHLLEGMHNRKQIDVSIY